MEQLSRALSGSECAVYHDGVNLYYTYISNFISPLVLNIWKLGHEKEKPWSVI